MAKKKEAAAIEPNRLYSLGEIVRLQLIPVTSVVAMSRLVQFDGARELLDAQKVPRGFRGTQYQIKGANITRFLKSDVWLKRS